MKKVKEICRTLDFRPLKKRGQNFLTNPSILKTIIQAAELKKGDFVLEIGPGLGILTQELVKKVKKVLAIEIDKKLVNFLKEKFKKVKNLEIIQGDILKIKNLKLKNPYKIVANLPYYLTGVVLRKFLTKEPRPKLMVLMVQKEVAERILAKNKKKSIISLMVNFYGQPEIVQIVSKNNFWPKPKVDSAILKITNLKPRFSKIRRNLFFKIIKTGFAHPRKKLVNNLTRIIEKEKLKELFQAIGWSQEVRAENLDLEDWLKLYQNIGVFVKDF
ncbi:MAG: 16S rRNA (adenine(1518)-N(6)/adenine(1519)-N(6))-dimethyltransferase RsmA [Patescibacteria group bacterium]|nr:16S rRNA (adenine(1518)-N(6)/adenine(1519)-N(6))-dimethyltransferase RsmA [Patescibacteria group bacterium]